MRGEVRRCAPGVRAVYSACRDGFSVPATHSRWTRLALVEKFTYQVMFSAPHAAVYGVFSAVFWGVRGTAPGWIGELDDAGGASERSPYA